MMGDPPGMTVVKRIIHELVRLLTKEFIAANAENTELIKKITTMDKWTQMRNLNPLLINIFSKYIVERNK